MNTGLQPRNLIALADGSKLDYRVFNGKQYLVVPVISQVGNKVVHPVNQEFPELVTSDSLLPFLESRNGRPVVMDHPFENGDWQFANSPQLLEKYCFGFVFNVRFEDNKVKSELWLDEELANQVGPDAIKAIERLKEGKVLEVSEGNAALVDMDQEGTHEGLAYKGEWIIASTDHVAILPEGVRGACDVNIGCGANRFNSSSKGRAPYMADSSTIAVSGLSQARRPTYSGTETSKWTVPKLSDYIKYLYEGSEGPTTVSGCSTTLKALIASHTLLGDPSASNFNDLTMLPVVNPSTGYLNERALRAIIARDASDSANPTAYRSAQDMARRLLNSEFGADIVNLKTNPKPDASKGRTLFNRLMSALRPSAGETLGDNDLWRAMSLKLYELVPRFSRVFDIHQDESIVIYITIETDGYNESFWSRGFTVTDNNVDTLTLLDNEQALEPVTTFEPKSEIVVSGSGSESSPNTEECSCHKPKAKEITNMAATTPVPVVVDNDKQRLINVIVSANPGMTDGEKSSLAAFSTATLQALADKPEKPAETPAQATPVVTTIAAPVVSGSGSTAGAGAEGDMVLVSKDELAAFRALSQREAAKELAQRNALVTRLSTAQSVYTKEQLTEKPLVELQNLSKLLELDGTDYSAARLSSTGDLTSDGEDEKIYEPPNSWNLKN